MLPAAYRPGITSPDAIEHAGRGVGAQTALGAEVGDAERGRVERRLLDGIQRRRPTGERPVISLVAAAEVLVDAPDHELVEPRHGVHQVPRRNAEFGGQSLQGVGGVPQPRLDVLLGFDHRHIGGLDRRHPAVSAVAAGVVDHPVRQRHRSVGQCGDNLAAEAVVGLRLVDESLAVLIDEDAPGEPQAERRPSVRMRQAGGPPRLIHQVGVGAGRDPGQMRQTLISPRAHGVSRLARYAVPLSEFVIVLEAAGRQQHTAASADRLTGAGGLDDSAGDPAVLDHQVDQRGVQSRRRVRVLLCCGEESGDQGAAADEVVVRTRCARAGRSPADRGSVPSDRGPRPPSAAWLRCGACRPRGPWAPCRSSPARAAPRT